MYNSVALVLCCLVSVRSGFIDVSEDYVVGEGEGGVMLEAEVFNKTARLWDSTKEFGTVEKRGKEVEALLPLVSGLVSILPVALSALGVLAGISIASSKAALLIAGGVFLYFYIRENNFLFPVVKNWENIGLRRDGSQRFYFEPLPQLRALTYTRTKLIR